MNFKGPSVSDLQLSMPGLQLHTHKAFLCAWVLGFQTQVLLLTNQVLSQLSCVPNPRNDFKYNLLLFLYKCHLFLQLLSCVSVHTENALTFGDCCTRNNYNYISLTWCLIVRWLQNQLLPLSEFFFSKKIS